MILIVAASVAGANIIQPTANNGYQFVLPQYFNLTGVAGACWIEWAPQNGHFYTGNAGSDSVSEIIRNGNELIHVTNYNLATSGMGDTVVVSLGHQDFVFVNVG